MGKLKKRLMSLLASKLGKQVQIQASFSGQVEEDLPIYEASHEQLEYWHAWGDNIFLQQFLARYDLDFYKNVRDFNRFKIGLDVKTHRAIFVIDEPYYHKIQLDKFNSKPVNLSEAEKVIEKINKQRTPQTVFSKETKNFKE